MAAGRPRPIIPQDFSTPRNKPPTSPVANARGGVERIHSLAARTPISNKTEQSKRMRKMLLVAAFMCASLRAQIPTGSATRHEQSPTNASQPVNPVIEWNRTLLAIVRTAGAQPATIHSTRSFAILHAAIFDSVNNIVGGFTPYLVRLPGVSPQTSQVAAADQAAHDVLLSLYPVFQTSLDQELQQDLELIPD